MHLAIGGTQTRNVTYLLGRRVGAREGIVSNTHWNMRPHIRHILELVMKSVVLGDSVKVP